MKKIVILGGGLGGLSAAWLLARTGLWHVTVLEKEPEIGGVCGTFQHSNFRLDYGPHKFYSVIPEVLPLFDELMDGNYAKIIKKNSIYLFHSYLRYPLSLSQLLSSMAVKDMAASMVSMLASIMRPPANVASYEDFIISRFGRHLYQLVFEALAGKTWGDPRTLSSDIARTRLSSSSFIDILLRLLKIKGQTADKDAKLFYYPPEGFGGIPDRMRSAILHYGGQVLTSCDVKSLHRKDNTISRVTFHHQGQLASLDCDWLISSIPLNDLVCYLASAGMPGGETRQASLRRLQFRSAILAYLFFDTPSLTSDHWIFFPGRDFIFGRASEQKNISASMAPPRQTVMCCDLTDVAEGPYVTASDDNLLDQCQQGLRHAGIIRDHRRTGGLVKRLPNFYPRYDLYYRQTLLDLIGGLKCTDNLLLTGRVGFYNYNNADHCIDMGRVLAECLQQGLSASVSIDQIFDRVTRYRIVD